MSNLPIFKNDDILSSPIRLLIKESFAIFKAMPRNEVEMPKSTIIAISRRYRSIVHECVENLSRDIMVDHSNHIKTYRELEVIWNLCEILLLDVSQTGTLTIQLKNWIKMHFDDFSQESKDILRTIDNGSYQFTESDNPETYWNLFVKLIIRGDTRKATQLLASHHEFERNDQFQLVVNLLNGMPLSNQYIAHEFCNKWTTWSDWCRRERETGQFDSNPYLLNVVRMLCQDLDVYRDLARSCDTWYQLMVAYLQYTDPCIKNTDLSELCHRMISIFKKNHPKYQNTRDGPDRFDEIIIATFEYDLRQVIFHCSEYLDDNFWFVTHFIDLLHCSNQLKVHEIVDSDQLRECYLQDYATILFEDDELWTIGVSYLDSCSRTGIFFLEAMLARVPIGIDNEVKTHKILSIAKRRGLNSLSKSICVLMAREWLSNTVRLDDESLKSQPKKNDKSIPAAVNLSNALYWAVKSGDTPLTTYISDQYLYYYRKTGEFPDKSMFDCLRRSPLNNERLAFLSKYNEFKQMSQDPNDDLSEAGNLLKALLASKIYPRFFCKELMEDAKYLLDVRPQLIFQPDKTLDLMRSVEEITKEGKIDEDTDLRKNLVRNMARALITPTMEK